MKLKIFTITSITILMAACHTTKTTTTTSYTYTKDVKAIIDANCATSCHSATDPAKGIDLTTYANVKEHALNGKLLLAIQHLEGAVAMPKKNPKLDDASIQQIVAWAAAGAAE